ncbi:MAG TPA: CAP domain-containing protein [Cellulomonas sp.]|uniref:CAP domain-containing protein n=1 Tax=Cellulomonas sp. TaxID=40001 RepID=UPI002E35E075|nr:CAP domain-containing protein [Cellulomonas sp.]HEX5331214.1 CAP domain-containing protein [Cellulomonas sp.]
MPTTDNRPSLRRRDLRAYRAGTLRHRSRRHVVTIVGSFVALALLAAVAPPLLSGDTPAEVVAGLPSRLAGLGGLATRGADQAVREAADTIGADAASRSGERLTAVRPTPSPSAMASAGVGESPSAARTAPLLGSSPAASTSGTAAAPTAPDATPPAAAPTTAPAPTLTADEQFAARLVTLTNAERAKAGLPALATSPCATAQAAARAAVLVAQGRFEHDPLEPVITACGGSGIGENLAVGYPTPEAMTAGWMASPGHRENILRAYAATGVGCVTGSTGMLCSQVFLG